MQTEFTRTAWRVSALGAFALAASCGGPKGSGSIGDNGGTEEEAGDAGRPGEPQGAAGQGEADSGRPIAGGGVSAQGGAASGGAARSAGSGGTMSGAPGLAGTAPNAGGGGSGSTMSGTPLSDETCTGKNDIIATNGKLVVQGSPGSFETWTLPFIDGSGNETSDAVGQVGTTFKNSRTGITVKLTNPASPMVEGQPFATSTGPIKDLMHLFPTLVVQSFDMNGAATETCSFVGEVTPNELAPLDDGARFRARYSFAGYCNEDADKRPITGCVAVGPL